MTCSTRGSADLEPDGTDAPPHHQGKGNRFAGNAGVQELGGHVTAASGRQEDQARLDQCGPEHYEARDQPESWSSSLAGRRTEGLDLLVITSQAAHPDEAAQEGPGLDDHEQNVSGWDAEYPDLWVPHRVEHGGDGTPSSSRRGAAERLAACASPEATDQEVSGDSPTQKGCPVEFGAGDGVRTRDIQLGKPQV